VKGSVVIKIENNKLATLLNLEEKKSKRLDVTTIKNRQTRAVIQLYIHSGNKLYPLEEISIDNIQIDSPLIEIEGSIDKNNLIISVYLNEKLYRKTSISISKFIDTEFRGSFPLAVIPILLVLFFILCIVYFYQGFPGFNKSSRDYKSFESIEVTEEKDMEAVEIKNADPEKNSREQGSMISIVESAGAAELEKEKIPAMPESREIIYFLPNEYFLTKKAVNKLDSIIQILINNPDARVSFGGHCALEGSKKISFELSKRRAETVAGYLRDSGWQPADNPEITGYGENFPVSINPGEQNKNRRVEITIQLSAP